MSEVSDRVVVVTGASSGIERATALAFADAGAAVVLVARRAAALDEVVAACRARGAEAVAMPADVRDAEALDEVARRTAGRFGRIDVWVNNAAVHLFAAVEESPVDLWHGVVRTNLFGAFHGARAALPWMREQGEGTIIFVSSVLGHVAAPWQSAYVASKHGVRALADTTRQEVRDVPGVHVCTVLPGPIDTPLFDRAANLTGRRVVPPQPVIDARRVAEAIVACAARPRREVAVGASTAQSVGLARLVPGLAERASARMVASQHFADEPARATAGTVLDPDDGTGAISGGWARTGDRVDDDHAASAGDPAPRVRLRAALATGAAAAAAWSAVRLVRR